MSATDFCKGGCSCSLKTGENCLLPWYCQSFLIVFACCAPEQRSQKLRVSGGKAPRMLARALTQGCCLVVFLQAD